jgi:hypothetical protein
MAIGGIGLILLNVQPHVELLLSNKLEDVTTHPKPMEDNHAQEITHKQLFAHS